MDFFKVSNLGKAKHYKIEGKPVTRKASIEINSNFGLLKVANLGKANTKIDGKPVTRKTSIGGSGGVAVRPLAFHPKGPEFDPQ